MNKRGWWVGLWCVVACGQELELPVQPGSAGSGNRAGQSSGITGEAGAGDAAEPDQRLPVSDTPLFEAGGVNGGGAGGESDDVAGGSADANGGKAGGKAAGGTGIASGGHDAAAGASSAAAGEAGSPGTPLGPPALLFTEYVEGSGSAKALELFALTASSLEGCSLETYFNGKLEPSRLALHGAVSEGETYVLCSSALGGAQPALCDRTTNLTFNGDDALALSCDGVLLDVIGQIGVDPGEAWEGATADHTLRRNCEVQVGRSAGSEPFEPALEWSSFGPDIFEDLGQRVCTAAKHR
jgi:hypothetical protein